LIFGGGARALARGFVTGDSCNTCVTQDTLALDLVGDSRFCLSLLLVLFLLAFALELFLTWSMTFELLLLRSGSASALCLSRRLCFIVSVTVTYLLALFL